IMIFFFQAEDGIRDRNVTGVQTCALPILSAQITKILKSRIFLKTEHGKTIVVEYPRKQRKNHQTKQLFTQILKDIWHHHLWIPVNQRTNQILQYDWLS